MRKLTRILIVGFLLSGAAIAGAAELFGRGKYETPDYKVVRADGDFEIRSYPELVVVTAPMGVSGKESSNSAFRMLFQYISGKNAASEKIAMTTPVFSSPRGSKGGKMSFVVPADVAKGGAPKANDESVKVSKRAPGTFAVYRYSGRWTKAREDKAQKKLQEWMKDQGIRGSGSFEKANYDPPFTPGFLRRNEVMIRIKG